MTTESTRKLGRQACATLVTVDNGTEFHGYKKLERRTGATIYFANPHHSWERGTSDNTGLASTYPRK